MWWPFRRATLESDQKVLQFPKLCSGCKRTATINSGGNYFCETCFQNYETGSARLKRVLYQIQRAAKIGRVELKGIALTKEGEVGVKLELNANIPHSYANGGEAKAGVTIVKDKIKPEHTVKEPSTGATWQVGTPRAALPPKPPEPPPEKIKPLVLRPINVTGASQETPTL